ncbi:MAG: PIN domain-containing protein [Candidatus Bathyarchaeia archaeon]
MSESRVLPGRLSIDSGVILAYFLGEKLGDVVKLEIFPPKDRTILCNRLCLSELFYVLCRRKGQTFARASTDMFLKAQYASVTASDELDAAAGTYKCERAISLADCYVLGLAKLEQATALFARKERELEKEIKRKPLDVQVHFLEDYVP